MAPDPNALDTLELVMDETRQRFTAAFPSQCDSLRILVDQVARYGPDGPIATLADAVHRLSGLAGTIGFPTISARASELEALVGRAEERTFDGEQAGDLVDAMQAAFTSDLARAGTPLRAPTVATVTVVVAEDDPEVSRIVDVELRAAGYKSVLARDGEQALAAVREHGARVVVLDLMMPKVDGFDVLRQLRKASTMWPRIIVLTGRGREQDVARAFEAGADDCVTKPFDPQELMARVARMLE